MNRKYRIYLSSFLLLSVVFFGLFISISEAAENSSFGEAFTNPLSQVASVYATYPSKILQSYSELGNQALSVYKGSGQLIWNGTESVSNQFNIAVAAKNGQTADALSSLSAIGDFLQNLFKKFYTFIQPNTVLVNENNGDETPVGPALNQDEEKSIAPNENNNVEIVNRAPTTTIVNNNGVSENELNSKLAALDSNLRALIFSNQGSAPNQQAPIINQYITYTGGSGAASFYGGPSKADIQNIQNQINNIITVPGNPFNQNLNTTDSPTFVAITAGSGIFTTLTQGGNTVCDSSGNCGTAGFSTSTTRSVFSATAPLAYNSATGVFSIAKASSTADGYLSSTDFNTFNSKQAAGNYITALTGDGSASGPGSAVLTLATVNNDIGTFNNLTVNAKGLVTAGSNVAYITAAQAPVQSVSNSDSTLTISPTTGDVVASLNLAHANNWTAIQTFSNATNSALFTGGNVGIGTTTPTSKLSITGSGTGTGKAFTVANSSDVEKFSVLDNGLVVFGGTTSAFPALKRNSDILQVRLADDSAYGTIDAGTYRLSNATIINSSAIFNPIQSGNFYAGSTGQYVWTNGIPTATIDTGLSRLSAAKIAVGNGTQGDVSGTLIAGNIGVGTSSPSVKLDVWGTLNVGTSTAGLFNANPSTGSVVITSAAQNAFTVGPNGLTNPAFQIDASTTSSANGLQLIPSAGGSGVTLLTTSSGANETLTIKGKGTGNTVLDTTATNGGVVLRVNGSSRYTINNANQIFNTGSRTGANSGFIAYDFIGATDTGLSASTEVSDFVFDFGQAKNHATGDVTIQRSILVNAPTYTFGTPTSTITNAASFGIASAPSGGTKAAITNDHALLISAGALSGVITNSYGLTVNAQTGATNNYTAQFLGGNVGIGTTTPQQVLVASGTIQATNLYGGAATLSTDAGGNIIRTPSDFNLKDQIVDVGDETALEQTLALQGVTYYWKDKNRFGPSQEIGFIAQDVEKIVPQAVSDGGAYKSLNYGSLSAVLVGAIREEEKQINQNASSTKDALAALELRVGNLEGLDKNLTVTTGGSIADSIISTIQSFGSEIINGIAYLSNIFTKHLTVGSPEHRNGITLYDQETGEPYCLAIINGVTQTTAGVCADVNASSTPSSGTILTNDENGNTIIIPDTTPPENSSSTVPTPLPPIPVETDGTSTAATSSDEIVSTISPNDNPPETTSSTSDISF